MDQQVRKRYWPRDVHELPAVYADRLYRMGMSVVTFCRLILSLEPLVARNPDATQRHLIQHYRDLTAWLSEEERVRPFRADQRGLGTFRYSIVHIFTLISLFVVTQPEDITEPWAYRLVAGLAGRFVAGPDVQSETGMGYGLRAAKDYKEDEVITVYGGEIRSQNPNLGRRNAESTYLLSLTTEEDIKSFPLQTWVIDARLGFRLQDKGRWANHASGEEANA